MSANFSKACSRATAGWQVAMDLFQENFSEVHVEHEVSRKSKDYIFRKILAGNPSHRSSKRPFFGWSWTSREVVCLFRIFWDDLAVVLSHIVKCLASHSSRAGNAGPTARAKPNMLQRTHQCL